MNSFDDNDEDFFEGSDDFEYEELIYEISTSYEDGSEADFLVFRDFIEVYLDRLNLNNSVLKDVNFNFHKNDFFHLFFNYKNVPWSVEYSPEKGYAIRLDDGNLNIWKDKDHMEAKIWEEVNQINKNREYLDQRDKIADFLICNTLEDLFQREEFNEAYNKFIGFYNRENIERSFQEHFEARVRDNKKRVLGKPCPLEEILY